MNEQRGKKALHWAEFLARFTQPVLAALLILVSGLLSNCTGVKETAGDKIEVLIPAFEHAMQEGDFHSAWSTYGRAYSLAGDTPAGWIFLYDYCRTNRCFDIFPVAWLLGKSQSDLSQFINCDMEDAACSRRLAHLAYVEPTPGPEKQPAQQVKFQFIHPENSDWRPLTVVKIGGKAIWAIFDTAADDVTVDQIWADRNKIDYEVLREPYSTANFYGKPYMRQKAVLRDFSLGQVTEQRVPASVTTNKFKGDIAIIGMYPLLRYSAVCFSWSDSTLYLGSLGPCRGGETPFRETLRARGVSGIMRPWVWARGSDGDVLPILVDTGSPIDSCTVSFAEHQAGHPLQFGQHPDLQTRCNTDNPPVPPEFRFSAMIGMETLIKFKAFGWELNPFRMYFVPKPATENAATEPHDT